MSFSLPNFRSHASLEKRVIPSTEALGSTGNNRVVSGPRSLMWERENSDQPGIPRTPAEEPDHASSADHPQVSPDLDILGNQEPAEPSAARVLAAQETQQFEIQEFSALAANEPSVGHVDSPFLADLGAVLLHLEQLADGQPGATPVVAVGYCGSWHHGARDGEPSFFHESDALSYYRLALTAVRELLLHPHYEMIDVVGENLGSHLEGVAYLLRSRQIRGDADGVRHAAYWTLYRHDIWAAMQTGRRMCLDETHWEPPPVESFEHMEIEDIANRAIFILGQCVNFSNGHGAPEDMDPGRLHQARHDAASRLVMSLDHWQAKMPPSIATFFEIRDAGAAIRVVSQVLQQLSRTKYITPAESSWHCINQAL
ncbi:catalytic activity protein [Colletotrichum plurivorum]|uniref:Catalytic activity protein n=1 Tax=Colletotrichum plurivorum TaxID=2175906 RepID=A0A8H6MXJ8_9PEZI|nr:catalytic activity protein [Colletotrichum plurivorum]